MMGRTPPEESYEAIGRRLRRIRLGYGTVLGREEPLGQREFAEMMGISKQMWNTAEKGRARLGLDHAKLVCLRTGTTLDYIYRGIAVGMRYELAVAIEKLSPPVPPPRAKIRI